MGIALSWAFKKCDLAVSLDKRELVSLGIDLDLVRSISAALELRDLFRDWLIIVSN